MGIGRRSLFFAISLLALAAGIWGVHGLRALSGVPRELTGADVRFPVLIRGSLSPSGAAVGPVTMEVRSPQEMLFRLQSLPAGSGIEVAPAGGDPALRLTLPHQLSRTHLTVVVLSGLIFFLVNLLVFCPRVGWMEAGGPGSGGGSTRPFYWCTLLFGMAILLGGIYFPREAPWHEAFLDFLWLSSLVILPVFFVEMSLTFPHRHSILDRRPRLLIPLWIAALVVIAWETAAYLCYFHNPVPAAWSVIGPARLVAQILLVMQVAAACVIFFARSRRLVLDRERRQMKGLLWGFTIGVAPYVFLRTLPSILGLQSPIPPAFDRLFELAIPIAFTFAVVLYRFLDIDVIIRRGLIYSVLTGLIVSVYLLIAVLLGNAIRARVPAAGPYIPFAAAIIAVSLFYPTRRGIGRWVDRTFFRIRYNHAQAIGTLRESVFSASRRRDVADLLRSILVTSIEPKRICVTLQADGDADLVSDATDGVPPAVLRLALDRARALVRPLAAPNSTSLPEFESPSFPPEISTAGFPILIPLSAEHCPLGVVLIGEKRSERRYVQEDIDLLDGAASIAAAALDRITLVKKANEEEAERHRLEELNRLKTDFLSRVAHDLRTPLASISWSSQNLLDGVVGPPGERQMESLRAIKASADQLGRLVTNLLEASRRETALHTTPLEPVDLPATVREAVVGLTPIAGSRGIRFSLDLPEAAPHPVRGNRAKMMEILNNLIENALKYSPEGASVDITIAPEDGGALRLSVRDHGPGFAEGEGERLFERFRQGAPSPYSGPAGFGLGLYVVRTLIDFMRATVRARNHPEGGAEFICTFHVWDAAESGPDGTQTNGR